MSAAAFDDEAEMVLMKIVLELLTPTELLRLTQRFTGARLNPG